MTNEEVLAGAQERIEKYRKADATLILKMPDGGSLPAEATVRIEQTRHAFLFSGNTRWLFSPQEAKNKFETEPELAERYSKHFTEIFNYVTIPIFWGSYERERGKPQYDLTQANIDWARKHGLKTKAHPLVWNWVAEPAWLKGMTPEQAMQEQLKRIEDFMTHFKGQISVYDVVNEPSGWDREPGWMNSPLLVQAAKDVGIENWVQMMYRKARETDPDATLVINDFTLEGLFEKQGIEPLMNAEGGPLVDVIGFQSHMFNGTWPLGKSWDICERFKKYGLPIHFTEVSIVSGDRLKPTSKPAVPDPTGERTQTEWNITPETEARQAKDVVEFYTTLFSHPAVEAINWWYVTDNLAHPPNSPPGLLRADMTPKPAYEALRKLIKDDWWTRTEASVDESGQAKFRGFLGEYKATVSLPDGTAYAGAFSVAKDAVEPVTVQLMAER